MKTFIVEIKHSLDQSLSTRVVKSKSYEIDDKGTLTFYAGFLDFTKVASFSRKQWLSVIHKPQE